MSPRLPVWAVALMALLPAPVLAALPCGHTVTEDTVLDADVGPCPGAAIVLVGPARLDLAGHAIIGDEKKPDHCVRIEGAGARLENGVVRACQSGVLVGGDGHHSIVGVLSSGHAVSGFRVYSDRNVLSGAGAIGNAGQGFRILGSRNRLEGCAASGNAIGFSSSGERNRLLGNTASGNATGFLADEMSSEHRLDQNLALSNDGRGFRVDGGGHRLTQNRALGNGGEGISLAGQARIRESLAIGNGADDLFDARADCRDGVWRRNVYGSRNRSCIR